MNIDFDKNAVVIPNGFDPKIFWYQNKDQAKKQLGFKKKRLIGFVGHIYKVKNVMVALKKPYFCDYWQKNSKAIVFYGHTQVLPYVSI